MCRTHPDASLRHKGLTMLLVPVDQPGVEIRPVANLAGSEEFSECFFTGARTDADLVVGGVDDGWRVVMGTLGTERGAALIPSQLAMEHEVHRVVGMARDSGASDDARTRQRLADAFIATQLMRATTTRVVSDLLRGTTDAEAAAATSKLFASVAHQRLGELAMDVEGAESQILSSPLPGGLSFAQRTFLLSRAETIYGGTSEIQRNIISERVLGLPR